MDTDKDMTVRIKAMVEDVNKQVEHVGETVSTFLSRIDVDLEAKWEVLASLPRWASFSKYDYPSLHALSGAGTNLNSLGYARRETIDSADLVELIEEGIEYGEGSGVNVDIRALKQEMVDFGYRFWVWDW